MIKKIVAARAAIDEVCDCLAAIEDLASLAPPRTSGACLPPRPTAALEAEAAAAAAEAELQRRRAALNKKLGAQYGGKKAPLQAKTVKTNSAAGRRRLLRGVSPPTVDGNTVGCNATGPLDQSISPPDAEGARVGANFDAFFGNAATSNSRGVDLGAAKAPDTGLGFPDCFEFDVNLGQHRNRGPNPQMVVASPAALWPSSTSLSAAAPSPAVPNTDARNSINTPEPGSLNSTTVASAAVLTDFAAFTNFGGVEGGHIADGDIGTLNPSAFEEIATFPPDTPGTAGFGVDDGGGFDEFDSTAITNDNSAFLLIERLHF